MEIRVEMEEPIERSSILPSETYTHSSARAATPPDALENSDSEKRT